MTIFLFTGEHREELRRELKRWQEGFVKKFSETNLLTFDDVRQEQIPELINAMESQPFLAEKRMIIVSGVPLPAKKSTEKKPKTMPPKDEEEEEEVVDERTDELNLENLEEKLDSIPETSIVIFVSEKPDQRLKFFLKLKKIAKIETFNFPIKEHLRTWTSQKFFRYGKKIAGKALDRLLYQCNQDAGLISHEIEKLSGLPFQEISEEHVQKYCSGTPEVQIFRCLEMLGKVPAKEASRALRRLFQSEDKHLMIFFMIVRQFRLLVQARFLLDQGAPAGVIQKKLGIQPFIIHQLINQATAFSFSQLKEAYRQLAELDLRLKIGKIPISRESDLLELSLDALVYSLSE